MTPATAGMGRTDANRTDAGRTGAGRAGAPGPDEVIVKDAGRSCAALIDCAGFALPVLTVPVVCPVGAGDALAARYLADRLAGGSPEARLRTAITAGAFAVAVRAAIARDSAAAATWPLSARTGRTPSASRRVRDMRSAAPERNPR